MHADMHTYMTEAGGRFQVSTTEDQTLSSCSRFLQSPPILHKKTHVITDFTKRRLRWSHHIYGRKSLVAPSSQYVII